MPHSPIDLLWFVGPASALLGGIAVWLAWKGHVRSRDLTAVVLVLTAALPAAWQEVTRAGLHAKDKIFASMIQFAPTYAQEMAVLGHAKVTVGTPDDDPAYLRMIDAEKRWLAVNPEAADIYTFRPMPDGRILFIVDAETDYDHDGVYEGERESRTSIGEEMKTESRSPIDVAMSGKPVVDDDIETDRWGTWISAYAPIPGPDGKPEALLGIDYRADIYLAAIENAQLHGIARSLVIGSGLLSIALIVALLRRNAAEREERHAKLDAAAKEVQRLNADLEQNVRERTAQLETANRELEAFAYSVSHDLRTPLRSIEGFARLVADEAADRLPPEALANLQRVQKAGKHMANLIDDLLRLSRVTRFELHLEDVDVTSLVKRIGDDLKQRHPRRDVRLVVAPDLRARADGKLLDVLVRNLLENAWKYTSRCETATVEFGRDADGVWFVRDNGCGFDMRFVGKLFRPFQRLHTDDEYEGNGIGLATVARIVARHGGRVRAQSWQSAGCTISFTLEAA